MALTRTAMLAGIALLSAAPLAPATAQKAGGVLKVYFFDSPASMSIHEEVDHRRPGPDDGRVQQPRHVRPARAAKQPEVDRARSRQRAGRGTRTAPA